VTQTIALTGGTGFIGKAIIARVAAQGGRVRALARDPSKLPQSDAVAPVKGDLDDEAALAEAARGAHLFIHCAGVTIARRDADYRAVNVDGAVRAARAAAASGARFIHVSSLSARLPSASPYARSKKDSEAAVAEASGANPWVALRAPAVYGPGDLVTLPYFRMVKSGLAAEPATRPEARASLLFVEDAADAILAGADAPAGAVYEVDDGAPDGRSWREIGETLAGVLGRKTLRIAAPRPAIAALHAGQRVSARLRGVTPSVRTGQINEFFHPDWVARENLLSAAANWRAVTPLAEGFAKTVRWYQEHGLL